MKKLEGKISFLANADNGTEIEIKDRLANSTVCKVRLTNEQLVRILSRQGNVDCEVGVFNLDQIGKRHENETFEFKLPKHLTPQPREDEALTKYAQELLDKMPGGWIGDGYFKSQNSFFQEKGILYARCTKRRWVEIEDSPE